MKVVINRGIGGFGLSKKAFERLIELGMTVTDLYEEGENRGQPINKNANLWKVDNWKEYNPELDSVEIGILYDFVENYQNSSKIRSNPLVIRVVEELGIEANDEHSKLKIVEIPDNVEYVICEDDTGEEWIAEKHRTWS
jgi:hypothetical protein